MNKKAIIFDLDGTLIDTLKDLNNARNYALKKFGYKVRTLSQTRKDIGNGVGRLIALGLPGEETNKDYQQVLSVFKEYYKEHVDIKSYPYEDAKNVIKELSKHYLLGVVTNKFQFGAELLINKFFDGCFKVIVGEQPSFKRKPSTEMLDHALNVLNISASEAIYIGDTEIDLKMANNANMDCLILTRGFRTKKELLALNIDKYLIDNLLILLN